MATVTPTMVDTNEKGVLVTWTGANTDVGSGVSTLGFGELTIQAIGDGTSVAMEGSNDGGTTWGALGAGVSVNVSGNAILRVAEHPGLIRPKYTGGTSTKLILSAAKAFY